MSNAVALIYWSIPRTKTRFRKKKPNQRKNKI